jgi:hypothetical protein
VTAADTFSHLRGGEGNRQLIPAAPTLGACDQFAVMAGSTATCAGSIDCVIGGNLGVYPGTSVTGNFAGDITSTVEDRTACAADGLAAWTSGTAMTSGPDMLAEMGGVTFIPGLYIHALSINIAAANPKVYLDAVEDETAQFIFNVGSTLTTCAGSEIVLLNGAKAENVFWFLGTALTMGANSRLQGNVLAGSAITIGANAKIVGRAIAQTAVTCETGCNVQIIDSDAATVEEDGDSEEPEITLADCEEFAVHGTTAITFGATNVVHNGNVGCYTVAAITASGYVLDEGFTQYDETMELTQKCARAKVIAVAAFVVAGSEYTQIAAVMGGEIFEPGKYYSPATLSTAAGAEVTLDGKGNATATFTFQAFSTLGTGAATKFNLINGAKAENVLWEVGTAATIGAGTAGADDNFVGTILAGTAITVGANVALYGRILAGTAITFGAGQIIDPEVDASNGEEVS